MAARCRDRSCRENIPNDVIRAACRDRSRSPSPAVLRSCSPAPSCSPAVVVSPPITLWRRHPPGAALIRFGSRHGAVSLNRRQRTVVNELAANELDDERLSPHVIVAPPSAGFHTSESPAPHTFANVSSRIAARFGDRSSDSDDSATPTGEHPLRTNRRRPRIVASVRRKLRCHHRILRRTAAPAKNRQRYANRC